MTCNSYESRCLMIAVNRIATYMCDSCQPRCLMIRCYETCNLMQCSRHIWWHIVTCDSCESSNWSGGLQRGLGGVLQTAGNAPTRTSDPAGGWTRAAPAVTSACCTISSASLIMRCVQSAINQSFITPEGSKIKTHIKYTVKVTKKTVHTSKKTSKTSIQISLQNRM